MASKLPLLSLLIAVTCLSQFYRVSNSVIAPELTRDLHLSAAELGLAGSAFFFALFAVQLPVGLWFDRFGARRTVSTVSLLAAVGAVWIAHATDATGLIIDQTGSYQWGVAFALVMGVLGFIAVVPLRAAGSSSPSR